MVSTWAFVIALALFGFVLLMLELFIVPGFGVAGIAGVLAILGAVWYANDHLGTWVAVTVFVVTLVLSWAAVMRAARGGTLKVLKNPSVSPGKSWQGGVPGRTPPSVGTRGVAVTMLRPAGIIQIADRRFDVYVDGPVVEPGQAVEVIEIEGNLIKVKAI